MSDKYFHCTRTQTIETLWEVNSGIFLAPKSIYKVNMDRIGNTPYLYELSDEIAFDIDWLPDYKIAEAIYYSLHSIPRSLIDRNDFKKLKRTEEV